MVVFLPLIVILITASLSSKTYNMALAPESIVLDGMWSMSVGMDVGVLELDGVVHVWLGSLQRVCPELFLGLFNPVRYGMKYFQSPNPKEWEREYRPCVKLHQEKWFQLLWNCAKLNSVSCTSNLLAPTCDFRKCTRVPPDVGFESSKSLAKTEFWNNPSLHCCAVFPT